MEQAFSHTFFSKTPPRALDMVKSTQIARLDGMQLPLCAFNNSSYHPLADILLRIGVPLAASVDDDQDEAILAEVKKQVKLIFRRLNQNSEPRASIEAGPFTIQYY